MRFFISFLILSFTFCSFASSDCKNIFNEDNKDFYMSPEALKLFKKADLGDSKAQYKLARMYADKNYYKKAFPLYKLAAEEYPLAKYNLAIAHRYGMGTEKKPKEAFRLFKELEEEGSIEVRFDMAEMLEKGDGVDQSFEEAFNLYKQIEKSKDSYNSLKATYIIATMLETGRGVEKDPKEAFNLYKQLADQGDIKAKLNVARMLEEGEVVEQDLELARSYRESAKEVIMKRSNGILSKEDLQKELALYERLSKERTGEK